MLNNIKETIKAFLVLNDIRRFLKLKKFAKHLMEVCGLPVIPIIYEDVHRCCYFMGGAKGSIGLNIRTLKKYRASPYFIVAHEVGHYFTWYKNYKWYMANSKINPTYKEYINSNMEKKANLLAKVILKKINKKQFIYN